MASIPFVVFLVLAFLVGSIPFAYIFVKRMKGIDLRRHGSGNVGATNASRVLGKPLGLVILILDVLKGVAAAWLLRLALELLAELGPASSVSSLLAWLGHDGTGLCLGLAAFLGHCFSPFLRFRGGKGVATAFGVYLVVSPKATILTAVVCVLIIVATRLVSLASITGAVLLPMAMLAFDLWNKRIETGWFVYAVTVLLSVVVIFRHRGNIKRLLAGKEHKA